jgi:hypothetical protein
MTEISQQLLQSDTLLLTGELGDQLFGSDIVGPAVEALGSEILWRDYRDWTPKVIDLWTRREGTGKDLFEHFHPIVAESPIPIRTVFDFFWWLNFSQKWQHVKYRFVEQSSWELRAKYGRHILHFFDTPEFQGWSLKNHDLKIGKDWTQYKLAAKDFIFSFTKYPNDLTLKKIPSLAFRNFLVRKRVAVTSSLDEIKQPEELLKYVRRN